MNKKTIIAIILAFLIELPIWFFLIFTILSTIQVDRLVWFLFWVYVPVQIITSILAKIINGEKEL